MDALARDHELREEKRLQEVRCLKNERRVRQTVKVFARSSDGQGPVVAHFQTGFAWLFFNIAYLVFESVGFVEMSERSCLEYFNDDAYGPA
jgi:hypothetical protein